MLCSDTLAKKRYGVTMATLSKLHRLLAAIESRQHSYSFRFVQARLRENGLPSGIGWAPLHMKYKTVSTDDLTRYIKVLEDLYRDSVLYSRRAVSIYDIDTSLLKMLASKSGELVDDECAFAKHYPFPLNDALLRRQGLSGEFVSRKELKDGSVRLIACSKRAYTRRENVDLEGLDASARKALGSFDELIGVRHGVSQAFDIIYIRPSDNALECHIDLSCSMGEDSIVRARKYYVERLSNLLGPANKKSFESSKNLFPLLKRFYADKGGVLSGMAHATGTNSLKKETMRNKRQDLRSEEFHKSGIDAIKVTEPYSVSMGWPRLGENIVPTIEIPGNSSLLGGSSPFIGHAILQGCMEKRDYDLLLSKLY